MNCSSIQNILSSIDPGQSYQLWGLAYPNNSKYCEWGPMFLQLFTLQDFRQNLTNPLYQSEIMQQQLDQVFLPICYAYSILRIFMVSSVIVYVKQILSEILITQQEQSIASSGKIFNRLPSEKELELKFYKWIIYISMILELICAIRDFVLFRGTLLYSNLMDDKTIQCYVDFYSDNFTCLNSSQVHNSWRPFNYTRTECNCIYSNPNQYSGLSYMGVSIISWIITESLTQGLVGFTIITLSRLNRKNTSGWDYLKPTIQKSILTTIFLMVFYSFIIYFFNLPLYYQFFNNSVVIFNLFWKTLMFILVFDRLYSKIWLEFKVRLQTLHQHNIVWKIHLDNLKKKIFRNQIADISLKQIYEKQLNIYYFENIQPHIDRQERETNAKLQTKWYDYLNYLLLINLIGIGGFGFLVFYGISDNQYTTLFWIGFTLAVIELIVFEISNIVFQLHCFFLELHRTFENQCSQSNSLLNDDTIQG